jgi:hypothetical protein
MRFRSKACLCEDGRPRCLYRFAVIGSFILKAGWPSGQDVTLTEFALVECKRG